ncbi:MAG: MFS transporter [Candidatus Parcubacteria bacterium]|nr:MFS transporter [Candidatus Parcubacteria bacterium]
MERSKIIVIAGLLIMELLAAIDTTGVTVMVPTLQAYFHIPANNAGWILMAYLVPFSLFLVPMGWLADRLGKPEKILLWSIFSFGISSACCALAVNEYMLIAFRIIKGISSAGMFATEFAIIIKYWQEPRRTVEIVIIGLAIGVLIGPIFGALFSDPNHWRYFFLLGSILALSGFIACHWLKNLEPVVREADLQNLSSQNTFGSKTRILFKALSWGMLLDVIVSTAIQGTNLLVTLHVQEHLAKSPLFNGSILLTISLGMVISTATGIGSRLFLKIETAVWVSSTIFAAIILLLAFLTNWINPLAFILYLLMGIALGIFLSTLELMVLNPLPTALLAQGNGWIVGSMQAGYGLSSFLVPILYLQLGITKTSLSLALMVILMIAIYLFFNKLKSPKPC